MRRLFFSIIASLMLLVVSSETKASVGSEDPPVVLIAKGMHHTVANGRPPQNPGAPGVPTSTTPWTPCGDFCFATAYRCETSRNRVCLADLKVNGKPATLIDGYTGSCVTMHMNGSKHDIMKGCTPPSDDSGNSIDPDFIFVTEDLQVDCFVASKSSKCLRTLVHLIPNFARAEQPVLARVDLEMRSPQDAPFSQRAGYALVNGVVEEFSPSTDSSDLLRLTVVDPHRNVGLFAPDVRLSGRSCNWFSMYVDECSLADQVTKTERSLRVLLFPGPLRQRFNPSGLIEPSPAGVGTYFSTNAEHVGAPAASSVRGELTLQIAGPHHSSTGALNLGWLVWYWPSEYLKAEFGLGPSEAGVSTIDVNRSASGTVSNQRAVFESRQGGLSVAVTDIGFSSPSIGARRIISVKVGGQVPFSSLASAMGIPKLGAKTGFSPRFSKALNRSISIGKSSVRILKRGSHELTFRFRDDFGRVRSKTVKVVAG